MMNKQILFAALLQVSGYMLAQNEWHTPTTLYISGMDEQADQTIDYLRSTHECDEGILRKEWCIRYENQDISQTIFVCDICDSVKGGKTYSLVEADGGFSKLYRQVGERVYRYDEKREEDVLMIDYSLKVGEEVTVDGDIHMKVEETGIFRDVCKYFNFSETGRMLRLSETDHPEKEDVWVEGIGSIYRGILSRHDLNESGLSNVVYTNMNCYEALPTYFALFAVNMNTYKAQPFAGHDLTEEEYQEFQSKPKDKPYDFNYHFTADTLVVEGYMYLNCLSDLMHCSLIGNTITLSVEELYYPFVFMDCRAPRKVDIRISGFRSGTYNIKYMDDEETKEVVCQGSTDIQSLHSSDTPSSLFDLQGRPLSTPLSQGMYIQDGKKVWVK